MCLALTESLNRGVRKVAIFADLKGAPQHIAIQLPSHGGRWKSKMGFNVDIEHELDAIESDVYGLPVQFMRLLKNEKTRKMTQRRGISLPPLENLNVDLIIPSSSWFGEA